MSRDADRAGPAEVDLLVVHARLVTMDAERRIVDDGSVAVHQGRIRAVGSTRQLSPEVAPRRLIDAGGGIVTPGFINAHQHVTGVPLAWSCIPDDLPPGAPIFQFSVPLHAAATARDEELFALMVATQSLRKGTTMLIEPGTVGHPDAVGAALARSGIRATVGVWAWDIREGPFAAPAPVVLGRLRNLLDAYPPGGLVEGWVTLVGHSLASDELLVGAAAMARDRRVGMTMHISPTSSDPEVYLAQHGRRPVAHLDRLGVLGPHLLLGHAVWLDNEEIDAIIGSDTAIAYCPWAYLRLGQGVTGHGRHVEIVRRGGRVALGLDAINADDSFDVLRTAALAAGLAKDQRADPTCFGAHDALEMATCGGAEAVGMADRIGSIEPGKRADLVIFDAESLHWNRDPTADPALALVWSTDRHVRHVVVDGRVVVDNGKCTTVDEAALAEEVRRASADLLQRTGIQAPVRWPVVSAYPLV